MSRPKIAHFLHFDGPGGGPRTVNTHISCYCNYYDLTVYHGGSGVMARACQALGVKHVKIPTETLAKTSVGMWILAYYLFKLKPDIFIIHGQWAGPIGALMAKLVGVKRLIYICHWPCFYTDTDGWRVIRNYIAEWIPCKLSNVVIALSDSNRYQYLLRHLVPEKKILKVPNAIDLAATPTPNNAQQIRQQFNWSSEHCHVVSVGRLSDQKRIDWLIEAWALIHNQVPNARLWIIGGGPEEKNLKAMAQKLHITDTCIFLGPQDSGIRFINAADIVVMTTVYESFGNIAIEAMACGKPIIANEVDGVCDTYTHGVEGIYVPPYDPPKLAEALLDLIHNSEKRAKMGAAGLQKAHQYSMPVVFQKYLQVIESTLKI